MGKPALEALILLLEDNEHSYNVRTMKKKNKVSIVNDHDGVWIEDKEKNLIYEQDKQLNWSLDSPAGVDMVVEMEEEEGNDDVDDVDWHEDDDDDEQKDRNEIDRFDGDVSVEYGRDSMVELKLVL